MSISAEWLSALPSLISLLLIASSLVLCIVYYIQNKYSYWERRGVPHLKPDSFFFGNTKDYILRRVPRPLDLQRIYNELSGHKFGGYFQFMRPVLVIRDATLIRNILVTNFSHFQNRLRTSAVDERMDPLSSHLLNLAGQRWKNVRYKLTPTFSSSKIKAMVDLMQVCISRLADHLSKVTEGDTEDSGFQDVQELMSKVTTDVIGACAFGLNFNAIQNEDSEIQRMLRLSFTTSKRTHLRALLRVIAPQLINTLRVKALPLEVEEFFMSVLKETVEHRELKAQKRKDFLQLLIDIQSEEMKEEQNNGTCKDILFTDSVVASNAFLFLIAGYETTATTLSTCLYELALNPDVGAKVREEVELVKQAHGGNLDYDALKKLTYMDAVVAETLRMHPPAGLIFRRCNKAFPIPDTSVVVEEGTPVAIPVYGLHSDPKYFPEPEKFKPERFNEENIGKIVPGSYLPFGDGPRGCIGVRFAKYEIKSILSFLVSSYTIQACPKTAVPLSFKPDRDQLVPHGGVWVRLKKIGKYSKVNE